MAAILTETLDAQAIRAAVSELRTPAVELLCAAWWPSPRCWATRPARSG